MADTEEKVIKAKKLIHNIIETVLNKSEKLKETKRQKGDELTENEKRELTAEEKEYKTKRKQIQEKLIKFATRIPAFMFLTDFREIYRVKDTGDFAYERARRIELTIRGDKITRYELRFDGS